MIAGNVAHADAAFEPWRIGDAGHAAGEVRSGYGNRVGFPRIANRIALHHQPDHFLWAARFCNAFQRFPAQIVGGFTHLEETVQPGLNRVVVERHVVAVGE